MTPGSPASRPSFAARKLSQHAALLVFALGAAFSGWVFFYIRSQERSANEREFQRRAQTIALRAEDYLSRREETLFVLRSLFENFGDVPRAQFDRIARELISRQVGIRSLQWVPLVPSAERARYEAEARAAGFTNFQFTEHAEKSNELRRSADRPVHAPVYYLTPYDGNEPAFGFDMASASSAWEHLQEYARGGALAASGRVSLLVSRGEPTWGYITELPVYRRPSAQLAAGDRAGELRGFLFGVLELSEVLEEMFRRMNDPSVEVLFLDRSAPPERQFLHYHSAAPGRAAVPPTAAEIATGLHSRLVVEHAGRQWELWTRPSAAWLAAQRGYRAWFWSTLFLGVAGAFSLFLRGQQRRASGVERLVAERTTELIQSRRELDRFLRAMPGMAYRGPYSHDLDYVSEGALALTGWAPEDFMAGRVRLRDLIHPDDLPRVRTRTRESLEAGRELEVECRIRTRDGTEKWVLSRGRGLYRDSGPPIFEGLAIDITAQKHAEQERLGLERKLLEGQKLESLGLLAGGIAHDFNNLLTAILGNAGLARLTLAPGSEHEPQLAAIEEGATRAAELCRQMLAYAGKGRFIVEPVDVSALAEGLVPLLKISIGHRAELRLNLARALPVVMGDATQLRQIVMNLVLNAADAVLEGRGEITVTTGRTHADRATLERAAAGAALPEGDYVFLEVRDNGSGMTSEVRSRIFDPFFTTKFAGRGLGLAAVLGIVRGHQAALLVDSTPGRGSCFRLLLPGAAGAVVIPPSPPPAVEAWRHTGGALVIDDDQAVCEVASAMMKSFGFTVRAVSDGATGLAAFQEAPASFAVVLLDLLMPGMTGEQTLELLRTFRPDVPVLVISGFSESDVMQRLAKDRGPCRFLHKPFTRPELEEKLRELLG